MGPRLSDPVWCTARLGGWIGQVVTPPAVQGESMLLLLLIVVGVAFLVSLLPVFYPGTIVSMLGAPLNGVVAEFFATTLKLGKGSLVVPVKDGWALTLEGVLAFYVPILLLMFLVSRGRR